MGVLTLSSQGMHLDGTPGRRLGVSTADPAAPATTPCSCST
ncbi:hypothetical protein [Streptomyces sp. Li-HN-5-11]